MNREAKAVKGQKPMGQLRAAAVETLSTTSDEVYTSTKSTNMDTNPPSTRLQPSITSFFQPRPAPNDTAPPGGSSPVSQSTKSPAPLSPGMIRTPPASASAPAFNPPKSNTQATTTTLPPQAIISPIEQAHIQSLRRINALLLPISYPDSFYHKILAPDPPTPCRGFSRAILWTDASSQEAKLVGGVVCRLEPALAPSSTPETPVYDPTTHDIYVQSLALLSPYRGKGLAAAVLNEVIDAATRQTEVRIHSLYAHVWTQNEEALAWYAARGFQREGDVLRGYYRRLSPDTAYVYRRRLVPSDHLKSTPSIQANGSELGATRPPIVHARSFQDKGPEREWNDLPDDFLGGPTLKLPSALGSQQGSAASSRSSSKSGTEAKGRKKRAYPAAAFGS